MVQSIDLKKLDETMKEIFTRKEKVVKKPLPDRDILKKTIRKIKNAIRIKERQSIEKLFSDISCKFDNALLKIGG